MRKSHPGANDNRSSSINHGPADASCQLLIRRLLRGGSPRFRRLYGRGLLRLRLILSLNQR